MKPKYGEQISIGELYNRNKELQKDNTVDTSVNLNNEFLKAAQKSARYGTPVNQPIGQMFAPYGGVKKIDEKLTEQDLYNIPEGRAQAQSGWNLAGNFIGQLATETLLGMPEATGYVLDFEELTDADKQAQEGFDNAFSKYFREAKEQVQEEWFPIYRTQRSFSDNLWERLGDATWIASQGKTLGTTMSLMLPSLAVAYGTAGVGLPALAPIAAAMFSRKAESAMEAVGTFETEYQQYLNEGKSDNEARELAGQTAAGIFKANAAMLPVDMMQYALGMKAFSGIKAAITIPGKTIAGKAANFGLQMGSEFLEEGYQSIAAEEHIKAVRENIDPFGIGFTERLGDYIKDPDIQEAALLGALSGGVFEGGSTIANKAYKKYQEYATGKTLAAQFNDQESFNKIDNKIEADLIARAAKHDKFDTYIKTATAYNDKIQADENITPEEKQQVADKTNKIIENATFVQQAKQDIQKINEDYKETPELATQYALNKFQDKVISDEIVALSEQKKDFYNNLKDPKDKAFINNLEITALERQNKNLKKDNKLSDVYKEILIKDNEAKITKFKENLELLNDKIKETEPSFDVNEYSAPSSLLGEFLQTTLRQAALENKKTFLSKELSKAEKKSAEQLKAEEQEVKQNKEKEIKKTAKQDIENAVNNVTADNIEEVEKTINDSDILNNVEKETYRNKLSAVKNKLKVQSEINPETTTDWNNLINNAANEKELDAIVDQMTKADVPIDFSVVNIKRQQLVSATPPKATEEGISSGITDINMFKSKPVETAKKILETNEADPQNEEEYTKQERESNDKDEKFLVPVATEVSIAYRSKVGDEVPVAGGGKIIKDAFNEEGKVILEEGFNHKLLEPDYATANTEIFLSIDTAHEDYNSTKNDINNVPIVIKNSEGEVLGYVHQLNWFDKQTLSEELMVKLKDETLAIRKQLTSPNIVVKSKIKYKAPGWLNQNFNKPLTLAEAFKKDNQYDDRVSFRILNKSQKLSFQGNIANSSLTNNLKLVGVPVQLIPSANGTFIAKRMKQVKLSDSNFADEVMHNVVGILLHVAKNKNVSQKVLTEEVNKYLYSTSFGKELADNFTSGLFKNNKLLFNLDLFTAGERSIVVSITSPRNMNRFIRYKVKDNNIIEEIDIKGNIVSQITPLQFETILKQSLGEKYINLTEQGFLNPQKFSRKVADENYKLTDKVEDYRDYLSENNIVNTFVHGVTTKEGIITYVTQPTIEIDTNVTTEDLSMTEGTIDPKPEVPVETGVTVTPEQPSQPTPTRTNKLLGAINTANIETLESEQVEDVADLLPINIDYSTTSVMSFSKLPNVVQENDVVSSLTNFYIQNLNENKGDEQLAYQQLLDDLKGVKDQAEANLLGGTKTANKQIAKLMNIVLDNFEEVKDDNGVTVFTGYKNRIELELNKLKFDYREEEYDGENSKESFDNDKNFKTDPEKSASARIKRVLNFIPLYEKGIQKFNVLGLPIYRDYYSTFNTIMEATADVPINEILPELDILAKENKYPETNVYRQVLNIINNDNDTLKNDFAKVFRKQRALLVKVLIYPNDKGLPNNNPYISNRSGSSGMLLDQWKESFKNKLIEDKKGNLRYDIAANKKLSTRFNNLKPSGNMAQYLTELSAIFTEAGLPVSVEALEKLHGTYLRKPNRLTLIDVRKVGANYDNAGFDQTIKVNFQYFFEEITKPFVLNDADGLKNDVFKNQANKISLLAKYENIVNPTNLSHSFKNGHGDTVYGFVNPHYLSSLISQIKGGDNSLYSDSFSNKSTWVSNADNINALQIEYIDSAVNGNNTSMDAVEFEDMSSLEREQTKTAFTLGKKAVTKGDVTVRYLTPTPSDKTTFPLITALKHQVTLNDLTADMRIDSNSKLADTLYDLMVQSELDRINETLVLFNNAKKTNDWTDLISGEHYSKINETIVPGSRAYFFLIPQLNETLKPFLEKQEPFNLSKEWVDITKNALVNRINELIDRKSTYWQEIGMFKRLDSSYMKEVYSLLSQQQIEGGLANQYAVTDYVVNSMMGYANSIMLLVGDPATFTKPEKSWDGTINTWQSMVDGTITNMFKRTAKDIAPGYEGLFEANEKNYNVLFIEEPKKNSSLIEDYKGVLSKQISKLTKIELADAQEWTTLKEHLRVMRATGIISTTQEKIMLENAQKGTLTDAQIGVILQPMKPVQVGRMNYGKNGKQFFVNYYIKTSSFPLIPQLTQGLEIDALRKYMEENSIDRLVPNTAVKNGFFNSVKIYENGKLLLDENNNLAPKGVHAGGVANNIHILDRSFFRIQQDIPYDPNKSKILEGSQLKKLKFGDLFEAYDFILNGESKKGYELKEMDDAIHIEIYKRQYESLMNKLKATQDKKGKYVLTDVAELKKLLVEEADARGFDYNDIMILDTLLSKNSFDNLPLFVHPALPKLEALLNSLISNNVLKTKFPGKSFVQGSSMGFDFTIEGTKDTMERVLNKTGVILTNEFTGELSYKVKQNSKGEDYVEAQVMMPWYFKESITPFINKVSGVLDTRKIDPKLLEAVGYRIPTQDHGSMVKLKVVGFLPKSSGDLIIVPPEMSKLMGSDFDVDKLYIHWYNYKQTKEGNLKYVSTEASLESYSKFKSIESFVKIYEDYNPKIEEAKLKIERSWTKQSSMLDSLLNKKELQEKDLEDLFHLKKETELTRSFVNNDLKEATNILRQIEEGFEENFEKTALLAEIIGFSGDELSILNQADSEVQQLTQELFQIDAEIDQISAKISTISESKFRKKDVEDRVDKRHKKSIELSNNFWKLVAEKDNKIKNIIDSFSKSYEEASEYERLSTKQLQNLSLEITHSILENTEISKRVLTPLDNNDIKDVLKDISEIKTSEEIDESKASQSALVYDGLHSAFVDINAAGQYGIGVGSVASTSHVLSQYAGLYLRKYKVKKRTINESILFTDKKGGLPFTDNTSGQQVKQDGVKTHNYPDAASEGLYRLDRIFGITGKRISQVVKNIQTESVDNAKNQRLFGMNLNKHTFGVGLFLAKTGLDENYIGNFLNQPIIIDYVKELNKLSDVGSGDFVNIKQKKEEIQEQLATKYGTTALEIKPKLISLEEMQENLSKTDQKFQVTVLESFISYDNIGTSLASLFRSINVDTKYLDKNITSSVKRLDDFNSQFYPVNTDSQRIGNIENLRSTLQFKAVEYGLQNSLELFERLFPYKSNFFQTVVESFRANNKLEELTENQIESLSKGLKNAMWVDAVINTYSLDELAERQKLLFGDNSLGNRVNKAKEKIDNLLIKLLVVNTDAKGVHTIEFPTAGTLEKDFNLKMQQSWLSLYKTHKRIAVDLVKYVLLNGNERNARDFSRFIPIDILKAEGIIDNITNSYNEILSNTNKVDTYLKQYFQHNPSKSFKGDIKDFTFYDENGKKVSEYYKAAYLRPKDETSNIKYADVDFVNIYLEGSKLLKRSTQGYVKIPTLGNSKKMITEYNISNEEKQSIFDATAETVQPLATNTAKIPEQVVSNTNDGAAVLNKFGFTPGNTVSDVLNYIIKRSNSSRQIALAEVLLEKVDKVSDINFVRGYSRDKYGNLEQAFGAYQNRKIYINPIEMHYIPKNNPWNFKEMSADELFGKVFLHELIHGFTANELKNNPNGVFATRMLKHYHAYVNSPQKSGKFKNAELSTVEFVAELFENEEFQKELNSIKSGKTNLLLEILETIINFVGGNINKDSLLAAALNDALNLMDTVGEVKQPSFQESINSALETTEDIAELLSFDSQQKELSLSKTKQDIINNLELYSQKIGDVTVSDIQNMNTEQIGELLKKICK